MGGGAVKRIRALSVRGRALAVTALLAILVSGCLYSPRGLETRAVLGLEVQPGEVKGETELLITGTCGSALVLHRVEYSYEGDTLEVRVFAGLTRQDGQRSGTLDICVRVPPGVNRVVFGDDREVIWTRSP